MSGVVVIILLLVLYFIKAAYDKKRMYEEQIKQLKAEWGKPTRSHYDDKIWGNIQHYFLTHKKNEQIDDITWNDLEMNKVYQHINHTRTSAGEEMLYHILRTPCFTQEELEDREKMINALTASGEVQYEIEKSLYQIGKINRISVFSFLEQGKQIPKIAMLPHVFACLCMLGSIFSLFFVGLWGLFLVAVVIVVNFLYYFYEKGKQKDSLVFFRFILGVFKYAKELEQYSVPGCEAVLDKISRLTKSFAGTERFSFLVVTGNLMGGSIWDSLFDYIRMMFHVDLIRLSGMISVVKAKEGELYQLLEEIGYLDSLLAIASYRSGLGRFTVPVHMKCDVRKKGHYFDAKEIYHPLVKESVTNSIAAEKSVLLTGSNASGKSTFLKTVAVNAIFSQTIHTVLGNSYEAEFFRVYSSMALRDDISSAKSYFMVEIESLKRIFDACKKTGVPVFCFVDEILRGTNTAERIAASGELLRALAEGGDLCFAATHDIELTYSLEDIYENYHFTEQVKEDDIIFDYRLKNGRANSRNAILLLKKFGFDEKILNRAMKQVQQFSDNEA